MIELNNLSVEEMKELQEYQLLEVLQQIVGEINVKRVQQMSFADGYSKYRTLSAEIKYLNDLKSGVQSLLRNFRDLAH